MADFRNNQAVEGPVRSRWCDVTDPPPHALRYSGGRGITIPISDQ